MERMLWAGLKLDSQWQNVEFVPSCSWTALNGSLRAIRLPAGAEKETLGACKGGGRLVGPDAGLALQAFPRMVSCPRRTSPIEQSEPKGSQECLWGEPGLSTDCKSSREPLAQTLAQALPQPGLPTPTARLSDTAFCWAESGHCPASGAPWEKVLSSLRSAALAPKSWRPLSQAL